MKKERQRETRQNYYRKEQELRKQLVNLNVTVVRQLQADFCDERKRHRGR